jgi:hypothetical protein
MEPQQVVQTLARTPHASQVHRPYHVPRAAQVLRPVTQIQAPLPRSFAPRTERAIPHTDGELLQIETALPPVTIPSQGTGQDTQFMRSLHMALNSATISDEEIDQAFDMEINRLVANMDVLEVESVSSSEYSDVDDGAPIGRGRGRGVVRGGAGRKSGRPGSFGRRGRPKVAAGEKSMKTVSNSRYGSKKQK